MIPSKPIGTEAEYLAALARLETIFQARLNTPEGDELEQLATLIEEYEAAEFPIGPPTALEAANFRREQIIPIDL